MIKINFIKKKICIYIQELINLDLEFIVGMRFWRYSLTLRDEILVILFFECYFCDKKLKMSI